MSAIAQTGTGNVTGGSAATAGSVTIAKPSNTADGDLLVAVIRFQNSSQTITPPSGWTSAFAQSTNWSHAVFYKYIPSASAETATSYAFSVASGTARIVGMITRITGAASSSVIDVVGSAGAQTGTASSVAPAITPARPSGLLLAVEVNNVAVGNGPVVTTPPSGMTTVGTASVDNGSQISSVWMGQEQITSTASTGTRTLTHSPSASNSQALLMQIRQGNTAPVVSVSPSPATVSAGATASLTATATDDGTIASYAWSVVGAESTASPALSGASTATCTFTAPAAGNLVVLQCVVTDDAGVATTAKVEVRVPITGSGALAPLALPAQAAAGTYTRVGSASSDGAALADSDDATYLQTGDVTAGTQALKFRLQPASSRSTLTATFRLSASDSSVSGVTLYLMCGSALVSTSGGSGINLTTALTDVTITATDLAAITDWGNLWLLVYREA